MLTPKNPPNGHDKFLGATRVNPAEARDARAQSVGIRILPIAAHEAGGKGNPNAVSAAPVHRGAAHHLPQRARKRPNQNRHEQQKTHRRAAAARAAQLQPERDGVRVPADKPVSGELAGRNQPPGRLLGAELSAAAGAAKAERFRVLRRDPRLMRCHRRAGCGKQRAGPRYRNSGADGQR